MNNNEPPPTPPQHVAVPIPVYQAVIKVISQLPWNEANALMVELQKCQQIEITPANGPTEPTPHLRS